MFKQSFVNALSALFAPGVVFNAEAVRAKWATLGVPGGVASDQYAAQVKSMLTTMHGFYPEQMISDAIGTVTTGGLSRLDRSGSSSFVFTDLS